MTLRKNRAGAALTLAAALIAGAPLLAVSAGCDDDRTIGEIETPEGELEIEQDRETGAIETELDD